MDEPLIQCRYCLEEIKPRAKVCRHCSRSQNKVFNVLRSSDVAAAIISFGVLIFTILQASSANEANRKAENALQRVLQAECSVFDLAQSVIDIAEVIPRTDAGAAFAGGSLSQEDRELLKKNTDAIRNKINKFRKSEGVKCP